MAEQAARARGVAAAAHPAAAAARPAAAALALVAAAIHFLLARADLIPGEPTTGWLFALMGLGFLGCAVAVLVRRPILDALVALYATGLVLAYVTTRDTMPIETIGIVSKVAETGLALIACALFLRAR